MSNDPKYCAMCLEHSGLMRLLEALCHKMEEKEDKVNIKFDAMEKALNVAKAEMDRRLEGMNEFREQLTSQSLTFASKKEVELELDKLDIRIRALGNMEFEQRGSGKWVDHIVTAMIAAAVILLFHFLFKF